MFPLSLRARSRNCSSKGLQVQQTSRASLKEPQGSPSREPGPEAFGMCSTAIAICDLLILVDRLCFDRYKIDYSLLLQN